MNLDSPFTLTDLPQQAEFYAAQKQYDQAAAAYEQLISTEPQVTSHYWHLGVVRLLQGQESEAQLTWLTVMAEVEPEQIEQWTIELLQVLQAEAERQEATEEYKTAWVIRQHFREIDPGDISNLLHLVQLSIQLERFVPEDLVELGLIEHLQAGSSSKIDADLLLEILKQVLDTAPEHPEALKFTEACLPYVQDVHSWIEVLLSKAVEFAHLWRNNTLACRYAGLCLLLDSEHSETLLRLGGLYQDERRYAEGIELAKRYFAAAQTPIQKMMGNSLLLRGLMSTGAKWQEAESVLERETALIGSFLENYQVSSEFFLDASILCSPLFFYPYLKDSPKETRSLQNQVAERYQLSVQTQAKLQAEDYQPYPIAPLQRTGDRKKLRIGYLSRSMRMHSVGWLSRWVFEHFDRDRFEVYAYFNKQSEIDAFSQQWFASKATLSCCFTGDILGIAKAIQEDEIDILVDLDSITSDYTCGVMALKPAPVQVTWLGMDASGLPAIDYFMADPYVLPDSAQTYYAEQIWRLPQTYIAVDGFEVGVPTLRRDRLGIPDNAVIYFSAQFAYKRQPGTVRLQMQILKEVPNSYFLVKGLGDEAAIQSFFEQIAEEEGVGSDRLRFLPRDGHELTHRANLEIADVVLDTFPYNGATTTLETLWMGIPMVTRVGQQFASRNSYTMMMNAGITEGIAQTEAEYVEWGVRLGQDEILRQQISWKLRQSRQTSPLWNARQFTRELEKAYEQMWLRYLDRR